MSQQDNSHDSPLPPSVPADGAWSETPATNRPAEGATRAESLKQVEQSWSPGADATDFLGLEQDAAAGAPGQAPVAATGAAPGVNPTQAWLFHMESGARAAQAQPANLDQADWGTQALPEAPEDGSADLEPDEMPFDGELDAQASPEQLAEVEAALAEPQGKRKTWLVAAGLAAALLAAGGWQYWTSQSKTPAGNEPVAWKGGTKTKPPTTAEKPPAAKPPAGKTPSEPQPTPAQPTPGEVASTSTPTGEPPTPVEPAPTPAGDPVAQAEPQPEPAPANEFTPVPFTGTHAEDPANGLATPKGVRRPDAEELASLWTERAIPYDAIDSETFLATPRVGAVRVLLKNGEHLQGRLHSVGQGHVRMDIALGRMSVDYAEVREIVQILEADLSKKPSGGLPEETAGLLYVTAKVPGGYLTGWLVQRTGGKLTLITEQAKKVTFEDEGFEPVSKGRARVVGSIGRELSETRQPAKASAPAPKN
jgi:hypothetical protein